MFAAILITAALIVGVGAGAVKTYEAWTALRDDARTAAQCQWQDRGGIFSSIDYMFAEKGTHMTLTGRTLRCQLDPQPAPTVNCLATYTQGSSNLDLNANTIAPNFLPNK